MVSLGSRDEPDSLAHIDTGPTAMVPHPPSRNGQMGCIAWHGIEGVDCMGMECIHRYSSAEWPVFVADFCFVERN